MIHWANDLIGFPWSAGACGPDSFDCWGLVRHVLREQYATSVPAVASEAPIMARELGWASVAQGSLLQCADIVLMRSTDGGRHAGIFVDDGDVVGVLHCVDGPGVSFDSLPALSASGYSAFTFWRQA